MIDINAAGSVRGPAVKLPRRCDARRVPRVHSPRLPHMYPFQTNVVSQALSTPVGCYLQHSEYDGHFKAFIAHPLVGRELDVNARDKVSGGD